MNNKIAVYQPTPEQQFIGTLFLSADEVRQTAGWLDGKQLHDQQFGQFWARVRAGENPHTLLIDREFEPVARFYNCLDEVVSPIYAPDYARQIAKAAHLRGIKGQVARLSQAVGAGDYDEATTLVRELAEKTPAIHRQVRDATDVGASFLELLDRDNRDVQTYIPQIDKALGGLERQTLSVLAARPSTGKTALGWQIARNLATHGQRVLFVSLEMAEASLWARAACGVAGLSWLDVRRDRKPEQLERIRKACSDLMFTYGHNLLIHDTRPTSTADVWEIAAAQKPDLIVVDHLRFLADEHPEGREVKRLGMLCQRLKDIAVIHDCHVMTLAQLNRKSEMRTKDESVPTLADLRDSGEIEEDSDTVMMLHVPSDGGDQTEVDQRRVPISILIRKARDGQRDEEIKLEFDRVGQWMYAKGEPR